MYNVTANFEGPDPCERTNGFVYVSTDSQRTLVTCSRADGRDEGTCNETHLYLGLFVRPYKVWEGVEWIMSQVANWDWAAYL